MKKILILLSVLILSYTLPNKLNKVYCSSSNNISIGLGQSINAVTSKYLDTTEIKTGSPIFDESWLDNQINNSTYLDAKQFNGVSVSSNNFENIYNDFMIQCGQNTNVSVGYDIFMATLYNGYSMSVNNYYTNYLSHYFYYFHGKHYQYTYSLPYYSSNLNLYRNNLNQVYINNVANLFNGYISYNDFFDMYGTHVIAKGIYGGKLDIFYSAVSNEVDLGVTFKDNITGGLTAGIDSIYNATGSVSTNYHFSLLDSINYNLGTTYERFSINGYGGSSFVVTNLNGLANCIQPWISSVESNPTLVGVSSDGLIPLWELLPSTYNTTYYKNLLKSNFEIYLENYNDSIIEKYKYNDTDIETNNKLVRTGEVTIDDSGRFVHNKYDYVDLNSFNVDYDVAYNHGYTKMDIVISMQIKEIDKGYQYVMLFNNTIKNNTYLVAESEAYEANGTSLASSYESATFTFCDIPIESFYNTKSLVVRYGASGSDEDDWMNKYLYVKIKYKE